MKFYIYNLGCKVNSYESNVMKDCLCNDGFIYSDVKDSDIIIINSCTVTNSADNKTKKLIRSIKSNYPNAILVIVGCFIQVNKDNLTSISGDILLGNKNKSKINLYVKDFLENKKRIEDVYDIENTCFEKMTLNNYDHTRAFIKIQDGCNNFCSYCIIPFSRGGVRSKPKDDILYEAKSLIKNGHKEIVLTGIHTGNYGYEFDNYDFASLLEDLLQLDGLERLRISSIEISEINDRVIELIRDNSVLVDHMHIPLQSGCDYILKAMNRKYNMEYFVKKIEQIRNVRPLMSITTDVIVGFPGETDEMFLETVSNIKKIGFTKLHVFPYSIRKGTVASLMNNQIDEAIKKQRCRVLLDLSKQLELNYMNKFLNKTLTYIPEIKKDGYLIGHTGNYLLIKQECFNLHHNSVNVTIKKIDYPYCIGE